MIILGHPDGPIDPSVLITYTRWRREGHAKPEPGVTQSQTKECPKPPETGRSKGGFSPRAFGGSVALPAP